MMPAPHELSRLLWVLDFEVWRNVCSCFYLIPPREGGSATPQNRKCAQTLKWSLPIVLFLEVWSCRGLLLPLYVQWPHFIWGPSLLSCHLVLAGLSPLGPLFSPAQGRYCDPGRAFPHWGAAAASNLLIWKEPDCGEKPSGAKGSQASEPWWHYLYFWTGAGFPICIWMVTQGKYGSVLRFFSFSFS